MKKIVVIVLAALLAAAWYLNISNISNDEIMFQKYMETAKSYADRELYEDAQTLYSAALEIRPDSSEATMLLANVNKELGNNSSYISGLQTLVDADTMSKEALSELVEYYEENSDNTKLVTLVKNVYTRYPEDEDVQALWQKYEGLYYKVGSSYTSLGQIYNGYMLAGVGASTFLVDSSGSAVLDDTYDLVGYLSAYNGWISVCRDGEWYYINKKEHKKMVSDEPYEYCGIYSEGYAVAVKDGKYGYINTFMQPVTDFEWDQATNICNGVGAVCKDGKWALVNSSFELITDYDYSDIAVDEVNFCTSVSRIFAKDDEGYHLLDENGEEVISDTFDDARAFTSTDYAAVCRDGKWGFIDADGNLVIDFQYDDARNFGRGFAPVLVDGLWGYIDAQNQMAVEPQFTDAYPFCSDGTAPVKSDESYYLIKLYLFK